MLIQPRHAAIRTFYQRREEIARQGVMHELAVREPFKELLTAAAGVKKWTLVVEQKIEGLARTARPDGTLRDALSLPRGYWEAKDSRDDLDAEIEKKFARGYPRTNIIFEDTRRAVLFQSGQRAGEFDLEQPEAVADLLNRFLGYTEPNIAGFEQAVERFKQDTPRLAEGLQQRIAEAHRSNKRFQAAFDAFFELCKTALNPNISPAAVDEMLIQHLLTERLMRTIFDNPDFARRNAIAAEVEKVIDALTSQAFNRREFLGQLDYFYQAIESAARDLTGFSEKQHFINTVYERFFQGYAVKVADTHGIVYTPQPIVDFMCAAVEEVLRDEFGKGLDHPDVHLIDPCTGTGNFMVNILRRLHRRNSAALPAAYAGRLFANEVMLLPYYIASLNIEHEYHALTGEYAPFEGLCFVDTLDLAEGAQMKLAFITEANSERVERQKQAPITVVIGNPPYNMGQVNENDNNKNRAYAVIDRRLQETYVKDSKATLRNKLFDPYVKFFRWAVDRLGERDGVVCYVSNNSFVDGIAFDGFRRHLLQDFTRVYHLDLGGNMRTRKSGTVGNVFDIRVGVGITVAVRSAQHSDRRLFYHRVPELWRKEEKLAFLEEMVEVKGRDNSLNTVPWQELAPDSRHTWLVPEQADEFGMFTPIGSWAVKSRKATSQKQDVIFRTYSLGVATNRDSHVYDFDQKSLKTRVRTFIEIYNRAVDILNRPDSTVTPNSLVDVDDTRIKWTRQVKRSLAGRQYSQFREEFIRRSLYRPFTSMNLYFDEFWNEERYRQHRFFPIPTAEQENQAIVTSVIGYRASMFSSLMVNRIPELHLCASTDGHQCFPFYTYNEDGSHRRENITDWALAQFRDHYGDASIGKWDIFYYVYGLLHHPVYRTRYADNLKRDLPRIPFAPDFRAFAEAGRRLADLHLGYETVTPYPLEYAWTPGKPARWRVEKMRLSKDKTAVQVNETLTLRGVPPQAFDYRLGNRSALDWVIDQYQVKTDKRSGITSDPNAYSDDERYIVELVGRVVNVSVQTVEIVAGLPSLGVGER